MLKLTSTSGAVKGIYTQAFAAIDKALPDGLAKEVLARLVVKGVLSVESAIDAGSALVKATSAKGIVAKLSSGGWLIGDSDASINAYAFALAVEKGEALAVDDVAAAAPAASAEASAQVVKGPKPSKAQKPASDAGAANGGHPLLAVIGKLPETGEPVLAIEALGAQVRQAVRNAVKALNPKAFAEYKALKVADDSLAGRKAAYKLLTDAFIDLSYLHPSLS